MGFKSVVPFRGELSTNGQNWITLGGGKVFSQAGATIRSPAGRWSLLTVAADAAAAAVVEFYANGVKRFELAIPSTAGIVTNTADFYDAAEGDEIAIVFVRNNAFNRNVRPTGSIQFEAAAGTGPVAFHQATRANTYASGSGSISTLTFGQSYNSTTSTLLTRTPCSFQSAGVLSHFRMVRTQNTGNVAVVATVHINGSPTSITVSMAAGFTGTVEDTTNTATIGPDDVVTIVCVETTSGGTYNIDQACLRFTSTDGAYDLFNATIGQSLTTSFVNSVWAAAGGGSNYSRTTTGLVLPHDVEISDARVIIGPAGGSFIPTWGLYNGAWFDTFSVPDASGITETKSTGRTGLIAGLRVALGIESATGASSRGLGAMGLTLREPTSAVIIFPYSGALILTGHQPIIQAATFVFAGAGSLLVTGMPVEVHTETEIAVSAGYLLVTGQPVLASVGITATPGSGGLVIRGGEPLVYTVSGTASSQLAVLAIGEVIPYAQLSQLSVIAVAEPPPPPVMASQAAVMAIGEIVPDVCLSQAAVLVLGHQTDCVTSLCQIWKITRRDGKVYRYTSLDRDLVFGGKVYKACGSLDPSASDNSSVMGSVGSQTLTGIIRDDGISEAELFGGLFDDAYVTSDLVSFDDPTFVPRRLASGWIGQITQGRVVHSLEVVSIGARIEQQALVRVVSPTCSHKFGDAGCGVNVEAMKIPADITRVMDRGLFYVSVVNPGEDARQWANGRVRFLDGVNAGVVREFKSIDFATGLLSLWALTGLAPAPGDKIEILPGCDLTREGGCTAYANIINFGGFPDVPGTDAVLETPNAKI